MKTCFISLALLMMFGTNAWAARGSSGSIGMEESAMVSNGQGISSPSFWNALISQNPAGLNFNQTTKLQIGAGQYNTKEQFGSAGILGGSSILSGGTEFQKSKSSQGVLNSGLAVRLAPISTSVGVSSHYTIKGSSTFDAGLLIDLSNRIRFGFMVPHFTDTVNTFAGGLTYAMDASVDLVVDADYNTSSRAGVVKPGVTFRTSMFQASAAYGLFYTGNFTSLIQDGFTGGLGIRLADSLLISYEYRGIPEHRLGLTLRFN
jgi:hypothetical protein